MELHVKIYSLSEWNLFAAHDFVFVNIIKIGMLIELSVVFEHNSLIRIQILLCSGKFRC
jgi:hypothetical protein